MNKLYVTEDWTFTPATLTLKHLATNVEEMIDPKTSTLLQFLMDNHNQVSSREEIYNELYGIENARADGTITAYVSKLRKLLEAKAGVKGKYIRTIPKAGYQFIGEFTIQCIGKEPAPIQTSSHSSSYDKNHNDEIKGKKHSWMNSMLNSACTFSFQQMLVVSITLIVITFFVARNYISQNTQNFEKDGNQWSLIEQDINQNNSVALSSDGLSLAYIHREKSGYTLWLKDTFSTNKRVLIKSQGNPIAAPAFSPSGDEIAFFGEENNECFIHMINLSTDPFKVSPKVNKELSCGAWHSELKLGYLNEQELIYSHLDSETSRYSIYILNVSDGLSKKVSQEQIEGKGDYSFSINQQTNQLAILRAIDNNRTSILVRDLTEGESFHVLTANTRLLSLEWLNNKKLIVSNGANLELIDIAEKAIRPTNLAKLKKELNPSP
ncbi:helix-turn-helix domain-containing protein [Psychrosphaera haliotis]|uniref:OmpR/PhoB-type domain-containing protein n=1 Tax=Psychrosphaera haliotis TaxID=555083 RepID=A0A6N8F8G1_9GAMM|nr:helix-turn-helix domain-containing protein [Psychrosphaera haliotis]MUH72538.1 hypothetical protein [Psychrosphaera haliotis]